MTTKITTTIGAAALGLAVILTLFTIPTANGADIVLKANVPFAFQYKSETLPAGEYTITIDRQAEMVTVRGPKGAGALMPIMTTLAATPHSSGTDSHLIFDKVGTTYTLSEIWEPGMDGVLVYAAKGPHEHHIIHIKR